VIVQQIENNIIVPRVMGKVSGFSPLVILLALLIGTTLFGVVGAVIAIPSTIIFVVVLKRVLRYSDRN
jgi:putative heme transporter